MQRKTKLIHLVLLGSASLVLSSCGEDTVRDEYDSREDCVSDHGSSQCEYSGGHWLGPVVDSSSHTRGSRASSTRVVSRGGFGSSFGSGG